MSASREKQKRRELYDSGAMTKQAKAKEKQKKTQVRTAIYAAIAIVFVVVFLLLVILNSNFYMEHKTAATVGDEKISVVDFDYYYRSQINNYANYFGDYWSTYAAYFTSDSFVSSALDSIQQTAVLTDEAEKAGYALTDEDQQTIDSNVSYYTSYASQAGYASADALIEAMYGKGCSADSYRDWMADQLIASGYQEQKLASFTYTQDDLLAYYEANVNDFDTVTYRTFYISGAETDELTQDEAMDSARQIAEAMAATAQGNEDAFNDLCAQNAASEDIAAYYADDPDYSLVSNASYANIAEDCAEWLFDASRIGGETTAIATDTGYYALYFVERSTPDYNTVNVRHILLSVEDTSDEDELASVYAMAEDLLAQWEEGGATEELFAELADTYSDDGAEGGLYEGVYKGQMVSEFEDWCFDASRQSGDTGIVLTSYGYHIMYFVSQGDNYLTTSVEDTLRNEDYTAWYEALAENYPVATVESGLKHCNLDIQ